MEYKKAGCSRFMELDPGLKGGWGGTETGPDYGVELKKSRGRSIARAAAEGQPEGENFHKFRNLVN